MQDVRIGIGPLTMKTRPRLVAGVLTACLLAGVAGPEIVRAEQFMVVALPDTQNYSTQSPSVTFPAQTQWIVDNAAANNIKFVTHVGDLVDYEFSLSQWNAATAAMGILDAADMPYGTVMGSNDRVTGAGTKYYLLRFGPDHFVGKSWYGGASPSGFSNYETISAGGKDFLFLHLPIDTPQAEIDWAETVLAENPGKLVVFSTHRYLMDFRIMQGRYKAQNYPDVDDHFNPDPNRSENLFRNFIAAHKNIFMVLCGHCDGQYHQTSQNNWGLPVYEILQDFDTFTPNGGDGWMRLLTFDTEANTIQARMYSPTLARFRADGPKETHEDFQKTLTMFSDPANKAAIGGYYIAENPGQDPNVYYNDQQALWDTFYADGQRDSSFTMSVDFDAYLAADNMLTIRHLTPLWGDIEPDPQPGNPNMPWPYHPNTAVTLTGQPFEGKYFKHWTVYDPEHPGDANYAAIDANNSITIVMDRDREIGATFTNHLGAGTALDQYVAAPDTSYTYSLANTFTGPGYTAYILDMTSQTWREPNEVDRTQWKHWVKIVKPDTVTHNTALLWISGGSNGGSVPGDVDSDLAAVATATNSVCVELKMVPNQRLKFPDEFDPRYIDSGRTEDEMIAYTWDKFLRTGDETWPARLPMTKAAVRAMDAIQDFCATPAGGNVTVNDFVVTGASKRGWTTWTTAAVDHRVRAIIPVVIDVVNVVPSMIHHYAALGFWAYAISDYKDMGIMQWVGSPELAALMAIVDPYSYRDRYTMPKYIINASGDDFFLPDSSQFYFDDLPGEKYLRYVPGAGHSLDGIPPYNYDSYSAPGVLQACYQAILNAAPRPRFSWSLETDGSIRVQTIDTPTQVKLWQATNPEARDFRKWPVNDDASGFLYPPAEWSSTVLNNQGGGVYVGSVPEPPEGWTAFFVELTYNSGGTEPFIFTTEVRVRPEAATLDIDINNEEWGAVVGWDPDLPRHFRPNTDVTLQAVGAWGKFFHHWLLYDPNHPGDPAYANRQTSNPLTVTMDSSRTVLASFASLTAQASPSVILPGGTTTLTASASGWTGSTSFSWSTGQTGSTIAVSPSQTTVYTVTIADSLGRTGQASVTVRVVSEMTALDRYVAAPDASYSYSFDPSNKRLVHTDEDETYTAYLLEMTSQTWRNAPAEVNRNVWKHWLVVVVPKTLWFNDKAMLFIAGGDNDDDVPDLRNPDDDVNAILQMAGSTGSVMAILLQVPNQPLIFSEDDPSDPNSFKTEDGIIARTFKKFGEEYELGGDPSTTTWPALLPMVKSAVRAMDTIQRFVADPRYVPNGPSIKKFVVAGGSKRGWTTWLTGAVDQPRVVAIAPAVIDMLNMDVSMDHHYAAYDGAYSEAVGDYVLENVMQQLHSEMGQALLKIVDPYEFRNRFGSLPKFMLNSTGDEFFVPDSAQFYIHDLPGPKWLRYVPNTNHSLNVDTSDAEESLASFYASVLFNIERPQFTWTLEDDNTILVRTTSWPYGTPTVRLWQGHVEPEPQHPNKRDFRRAVVGDIWSSSPLTPLPGGAYAGQVTVPETGWTGFFVELEYAFPYIGVPVPPLKFTTQIRIVPEIDPYVTLHAQVNNAQCGHVEVSPAPHVPNTTNYRIDTAVELTAVAEPNCTFFEWWLFDPNYPGDTNHVARDPNNPATIMMGRTDLVVQAMFGVGELAVTASADPPLVLGSGSSTLTAQASGGIGPYTYEWNTGQTMSSITVNVTETTEYTVTVTDAVGHEETANVSVVVGPLLTVSAAADPNVILPGQNSTVTATATGGTPPLTYLWNTGQPDSVITVSPTQTTTYAVTVTDGLGQAVQASATVTVPPPVSVSVNVNPSVVTAGQSSTLTANVTGGYGQYAYAWSTGGNQPSITVSPTQTTQYSVTVTDQLGQQAQGSGTVTVAPDLGVTAVAEPNLVASGQASTLTATASGGYGTYSYRWDTGGTTASVTVNPTRTLTYTVTATDQLAQQAQAQVTVTVAPALHVSAQADPTMVKAGGSSTLTAAASGGAGTYTYEWSTGQQGRSISVVVDQTTQFTVTATDGVNQTATASVTVQIAPPLTVTAQSNKGTIASGGSATLTATPSGGVAPYAYDWGNGQTTQSITVSPTETTDYAVTVTDSVGQEARSASVTVTVASGVVVAASANPSTIASGRVSTLTATAEGGVGPYTYRWSTGASGDTVSVGPTQTTEYSVTATDSLGQSSQATVTVSVAPSMGTPTVQADPNLIAQGGSSTLTATITGGIAPYTYTWRSGQTALPGQTVVVSPTKTTNYSVEIVDAVGQIARGGVTVTVAPPLSASANADEATILQGGLSTLSATASGGVEPYAFAWSTGAAGATTTVNPPQTTAYTVTVTDALNNQATASTTVTVVATLTLTASAEPNVIARGQASALTARYSGGKAPYTHQWSNGLTGLSIRVSPFQTTTYSVTTTDAMGQTATAETTVTVAGLVEVTASASPERIVKGRTSTLTATASGGVGPYQYSWSDGQNGQTVTVKPTSSRTYTVTVTDARAQQATGSVRVEVAKQYELTVTKQGQGTVDNPGGKYDEGTVVSVRAEPSNGWTFAFWGGTPTLPNGAAASNSLSVVMNTDRSLTAVFVPEQTEPNTTPNNPLLPTTWCANLAGAGQMGLFWATCFLGLAGLSWQQKRRRR